MGEPLKAYEYISVHRCFGLMRRDVSADKRITFEELALLCHIRNATSPSRMSELAEYQNALRPTITHRTAHLARLGYISRSGSSSDRRNICCRLTNEGNAKLDATLDLMIESAHSWNPKAKVDRQRICDFLDNAGVVSLLACELILLALYTKYCNKTTSASVGELSQKLGLLQPTVSMAVSALTESGDVERALPQANHKAPASSAILLTSSGKLRAEEIFSRVEAISVL